MCISFLIAFFLVNMCVPVFFYLGFICKSWGGKIDREWGVNRGGSEVLEHMKKSVKHKIAAQTAK